MPCFGIGMINDDFHIARILQVVAERLKRVVMYSMALGPRCFKWKMLSLSGPKALLFLQLLIAFITRSVVNVRTMLCCLPTPMTLASGGSLMFPLVVHQPASPSIWPAVQSLRRGLSTNPGATMWCVCGCS